MYSSPAPCTLSTLWALRTPECSFLYFSHDKEDLLRSQYGRDIAAPCHSGAASPSRLPALSEPLPRCRSALCLRSVNARGRVLLAAGLAGSLYNTICAMYPAFLLCRAISLPSISYTCGLCGLRLCMYEHTPFFLGCTPSSAKPWNRQSINPRISNPYDHQ